MVLISVSALLHCDAQTTNVAAAASDSYLPKLRIAETNAFTGRPATAYRFTEEQLAHMARTKLETNRLVVHLEERWPVERLKAYCTKTEYVSPRLSEFGRFQMPRRGGLTQR